MQSKVVIFFCQYSACCIQYILRKMCNTASSKYKQNRLVCVVISAADELLILE